MKALLTLSVVFLAAGSATAGELKGDKIPTAKGVITIHPINHGTFAMEWNGTVIYIDPVGGAARFEKLPRPDLILITDIHGDHLNADTVKAVSTDSTKIVAPAAVAERLPEPLQKQVSVLANGESTEISGIKITAVPMYNLTPDRLKFHEKGRGNGYVLEIGGKRIYISGDTEDVPEMRALKDIDVAFVCMNLPYTMNVEQAASAVREFKPTIVYPYHYRGSDVAEFEKRVEQDGKTEVRLRDWY